MTRLLDPPLQPNRFEPDCRPDALRSGPLRHALLDSRQRWHDLVSLAADLAFETDATGRFVFLAADTVLGWPAATLLGQPAELLLAGTHPAGGPQSGFNPFRPITGFARQTAWLKRADRSLACFSFTATPLFDALGRLTSARGVGTDISDREAAEATMAATLRRHELIDHILWLMRQEVLAPRMMQAVLQALARAVGAEGSAVLDILGGGDPIQAGVLAGPSLSGAAATGSLLHQSGGGAEASGVAAAATRMMRDQMARQDGARQQEPRRGPSAGPPANTTECPETSHGLSGEGRPVLTCVCQPRFGQHAGLVVWRAPGGRAWNDEDGFLVAAAASIVRVVLEHEAIQHEMARQARTDPLTGLLNRRAFLEEVARHVDRLDREAATGTLLLIDLDNFKLLNDRLGHEHGDRMLCAAASLLRDTVRPSDLVARLGGDEFALWLNGADHLTAAERAERLRVDGPRRLTEIAAASAGAPPGTAETSGPTMSIGIATRDAGGGETIESLMRRADLAMYKVKHSGRGHWRVSLDGPTG